MLAPENIFNGQNSAKAIEKLDSVFKAYSQNKMKQKSGGFSCDPFVWGYLSDWKDVA